MGDGEGRAQNGERDSGERDSGGPRKGLRMRSVFLSITACRSASNEPFSGGGGRRHAQSSTMRV